MNFSLSDKHIVVTYHYVEDPSKDFSGIHPCPLKEFERQIAFLSEHFRIGSIEDVFTAAKSGSTEGVCAITFDDGLKDQYENAVPILKTYKAPATFFIITGTLEGVVPATHKVHVLLSSFKGDELADKGNTFLEQKYPHIENQYHISKNERLTEKRALLDDVPTANFKETMARLPQTVRDDFLNWLFESQDIEKKKIAHGLFMSSEEIKHLHTQGFDIGSHTHRHETLDVARRDNVQNTIHISKKYLVNLLGKPQTLFCYPRGGFNRDVCSVLQEEGFRYAVTIEERAVNSKDEPLLIPRYDTNAIRDFLNQ